MAIDDAGGNPETKACSIEILSGVEGFEETGLHGPGHTGASIGDSDANSSPTIRISFRIINGIVRTDEETATTLAHRIDGVRDEVVEHLADVVFKAEDSRTCRVTGLDVNAGVGEAAMIKIEHSIDEVGCAYLGGAYGLAMETQSLGGDLADAGKFSLGDLNVTSYALGKIVG